MFVVVSPWSTWRVNLFFFFTRGHRRAYQYPMRLFYVPSHPSIKSTLFSKSYLWQPSSPSTTTADKIVDSSRNKLMSLLHLIHFIPLIRRSFFGKKSPKQGLNAFRKHHCLFVDWWLIFRYLSFLSIAGLFFLFYLFLLLIFFFLWKWLHCSLTMSEESPPRFGQEFVRVFVLFKKIYILSRKWEDIKKKTVGRGRGLYKVSPFDPFLYFFSICKKNQKWGK